MIGVLVADKNQILRRGLISLLAEYPEFRVVGQASSVEEVLSLATKVQPDVITIDVRIPGAGGIAATEKIRQMLPECKILVLTASDTDKDLFASIKAGALGYVLKDVGLDEIIDAIRTVARGEAVISSSIATRLLDEYRRVSNHDYGSEESELSSRELEVLKLVSVGASNKQIALKLFVTESTVKAHLRRILQKLHANNRTEATAIAHARGLIG